MIKPNLLKFTTLLSIFTLSLIAKIAIAEVSQTYDDFSGQTTISVAPNLKNWKEVPTLYLNHRFKGRIPAEKPNMVFFSVIAPISTYAECATGVTGVIADSERIPTADDRSPQLARLGLPNMEPLGRTNPQMNRYISLFARYELEDFRKIANANSVSYQLCGSTSRIFELNAQEKQDLKDYLKAIAP